jgi:Thoeris protein ThsB, TIR-like domain
VVDASAAAGFSDSSLWEEAKKKGDEAIKRLINKGLEYTTVTAALIGAQTSTRPWVKYEIERSIARGNGLLGIYIHMLKDQHGKTDTKGAKPKLLIDHAAPCYNWDKDKFATWVEKAAVKAGHPCLKHGKKGCVYCA